MREQDSAVTQTLCVSDIWPQPHLTSTLVPVPPVFLHDDDDDSPTSSLLQQLKGLTCSHNKGASAEPACTPIKCVEGGGKSGGAPAAF